MANQFLRPNWHEINKAISTSPETRQQLWKDLDAFRKKISVKCNEQRTLEQTQREYDRIRAIKQLPEGAELYFVGNWDKLAGATGKKVKDGRTRIVVDFGDRGKFNCLYAEISTIQPTAADLAARRTALKIMERITSTQANETND